MNAWTATLHCPNCDGTDFDECAPPNVKPSEAVASHKCRACHKEWAIRIQIVNVPTPGAALRANDRAKAAAR